jgi:hypothetical protein
MVRLEDLREATLYFNKWDMNMLIQNQRQEADKAVEAINLDSLLSTPVEDIVASIATKFELDVPSLLRDEAHLEEPRETTITVQDYGRTIHQKGTLLTLVVPFTGDAGMFWVRPAVVDLMTIAHLMDSTGKQTASLDIDSRCRLICCRFGGMARRERLRSVVN